MDIGEIIGDAIAYPMHNIKSLVIYIIIGIITGILGGASLLGMVMSVTGDNVLAAGGFGFLGIIIIFIGGLLISGYGLDIIKYGIERRDDGPGIDFVRQIVNAIKLLIVGLVYYIVPAIITWLLFTLLGKGILTVIIALIICIVFALAEFMAICRLAKYDSLGEALAIGEAIGDISRVGVVKLLITVIIVFVIAIVVFLILLYVYKLNDMIGGILLGIFGVYITFFYNRAVGLLYSDA